MGPVIQQGEVECHALAAVSTFQLKILAVVDKYEPQMLTHVLVQPHNLGPH